MTGTTALRIVSGVIGAVLAGIGIISAGNPADFGLTPVASHWLTVVAAVLGVIGSGLPGWVKGVHDTTRKPAAEDERSP
jgi:hypothetical protein